MAKSYHKLILSYALCCFSALFGIHAEADVIEFSVDELAAETVLPVFEPSVSVRDRIVAKSGRFELGLGGGISLNEPFYNPQNLVGNLTYHMTEVHGINLSYTHWLDGLSSYGTQLRAGQGFPAFDPSLAPSPESLIALNYQNTAYYGKISLTKQTVMNLSIYGLAGLGAVGLSREGGYKIGAHAGVGQKVYFTPSLAFRFDLRFFAYRGPDPTTLDLDPALPPPPPDSFGQDFFFNTLLNLGLVYIL